MMFLARSAFWLSIVYAHIPWDGGEALRAVNDTESAVVASAASVVRDKCAEDPATCRAIVSAAAGVILAPGAERAPATAPRPTPRAEAKAKGARSANSLTAADLAPPWRGRPVKSGA
jgi:hypothetical protein